MGLYSGHERHGGEALLARGKALQIGLLLMKKLFFKKFSLWLKALIYSRDGKEAWESLAMLGRRLGDGARACYTRRGSTQSKGRRASNRRLLDGREG